MVNDDEDDAMAHCCAECGEKGGVVSLKACMSCKLVKYCNAKCQKNHWPKHKKRCKQRAAELRDVALFKDPPPKEDCPICFLPMPIRLLSCMTLPPATRSSVPICDFADENEELADKHMEDYYSCCGKSICKGCVYSFDQSENNICPFCNSDRGSKTEEEDFEEISERAKANDPGAMIAMARYYFDGLGGIQPDHSKAIEILKRAAELGSSDAHCKLGDIYYEGGDLKKTKFHYEAAAMAGYEMARYITLVAWSVKLETWNEL